MKVTQSSPTVKNATCSGGLRPPVGIQPGASIRRSQSAATAAQSGIALIVTLIMLSVITFLTVTFLVLSQRETGSVTTSTDQLVSKQAADSATERAKIELLAPMLALNNSEVYDLLVSTNFINPGGFHQAVPLAAGESPFTNISYVLPNGNPVAGTDMHRMLTNLFYNPRPPVYMTNRLTGQRELRYYLDLNRNGMPDTNGLIIPQDVNGDPLGTNYVWQIGDPEWIGVLERPDQPHSSSNRFVSRYAYIVVPAGKTLDVNYIHNQAKRRGPTEEGFLRNQGVGSYEINLAGFLADLNPRFWSPTVSPNNPYIYITNSTLPSRGAAFEDAFDIVRYRYGRNLGLSYANLSRADDVFPNALLRLGNDGIDQYSDGGLMAGSKFDEIGTFTEAVTQPWSGSDNPVHYFTAQELFDGNRTSLPFTNRLSQASTNLSTFDRYTYYRMLGQLGTDSEPDHRMNLNYVNVDDAMNVIPGMETNLIAWTPLQFFTNAAERLLRAQFPRTDISVTNIPVFERGQLVYSPTIHRVLQLAANMYEATTLTNHPALFRPYFSRSATNNSVYICGFEEVTAPLSSSGGILSGPYGPPMDLYDSVQAIGTETRTNIYGVPWVIGARKGFPNVNEIAANSRFNLTRRLLVRKPSQDSAPSTFTFEQQLLMDIWSEFGVEAWNSYRTNFPGARIFVYGSFGFGLTNSDGYRASREFVFNPNNVAPTNVVPWLRCNDPADGPSIAPDPKSFVVPIRTNFTIVGNAVYDSAANVFRSTNNAPFESINNRPVLWGLTLTNRIQVVICDQNLRVFDYVQLRGPVSHRDLSSEIRTEGYGLQGLWNTNLTQNAPVIPEGINYQIRISQGDPGIPISDWNTFGVNQASGASKDKAIAEFKAFYLSQAVTYNGIRAAKPTNLVMQAPFTPTRSISVRNSWQANDPLVHYQADDLYDRARSLAFDEIKPPGTTTNLLPNIGELNDRYSPWGGNPLKSAGSQPVSPSDLNVALKDPGVRMSDDWDFPTNKLPNIGWLGRVHRGTPWQTVYLKAENIVSNNVGLTEWMDWSGHANTIAATNSAPINDRMIFDLFTVTPNQNAGRGRLSVNQTNLAAWSAVLSGVLVVSNNPVTRELHPAVIEPAAVAPQVSQIVNGLIRTKSVLVTNNNQVFQMFPENQFSRIGDILAVPELTQASPFLQFQNLRTRNSGGINDAVMERIPQQIMSLLALPKSPRFVIYSYGQSLRPAENSILRTFDAFRGLCTNYQVTAESATRTVLRVDGSFDPRDATNSVPSLRYPPRVVVEQFNMLPPD